MPRLSHPPLRFRALLLRLQLLTLHAVFLDEVRDQALTMLDIGPDASLQDEWVALGVAVGQLAAAPLLEGWLRDHGQK